MQMSLIQEKSNVFGRDGVALLCVGDPVPRGYSNRLSSSAGVARFAQRIRDFVKLSANLRVWPSVRRAKGRLQRHLT